MMENIYTSKLYILYKNRRWKMIHNSNTLEWLEVTFKGKKYVSKREAATVLSVSVASINNYMAQEFNPLISVKMNSSRQSAVRISLKSLAKFIDNLEKINKVRDE